MNSNIPWNVANKICAFLDYASARTLLKLIFSDWKRRIGFLTHVHNYDDNEWLLVHTQNLTIHQSYNNIETKICDLENLQFLCTQLHINTFPISLTSLVLTDTFFDLKMVDFLPQLCKLSLISCSLTPLQICVIKHKTLRHINIRYAKAKKSCTCLYIDCVKVFTCFNIIFEKLYFGSVEHLVYTSDNIDIKQESIELLGIYVIDDPNILDRLKPKRLRLNWMNKNVLPIIKYASCIENLQCKTVVIPNVTKLNFEKLQYITILIDQKEFFVPSTWPDNVTLHLKCQETVIHGHVKNIIGTSSNYHTVNLKYVTSQELCVSNVQITNFSDICKTLKLSHCAFKCKLPNNLQNLNLEYCACTEFPYTLQCITIYGNCDIDWRKLHGNTMIKSLNVHHNYNYSFVPYLPNVTSIKSKKFIVNCFQNNRNHKIAGEELIYRICEYLSYTKARIVLNCFGITSNQLMQIHGHSTYETMFSLGITVLDTTCIFDFSMYSKLEKLKFQCYCEQDMNYLINHPCLKDLHVTCAWTQSISNIISTIKLHTLCIIDTQRTSSQISLKHDTLVRISMDTQARTQMYTPNLQYFSDEYSRCTIHQHVLKELNGLPNVQTKVDHIVACIINSSNLKKLKQLCHEKTIINLKARIFVWNLLKFKIELKDIIQNLKELDVPSLQIDQNFSSMPLIEKVHIVFSGTIVAINTNNSHSFYWPRIKSIKCTLSNVIQFECESVEHVTLLTFVPMVKVNKCHKLTLNGCEKTQLSNLKTLKLCGPCDITHIQFPSKLILQDSIALNLVPHHITCLSLDNTYTNLFELYNRNLQSIKCENSGNQLYYLIETLSNLKKIKIRESNFHFDHFVKQVGQKWTSYKYLENH